MIHPSLICENCIAYEPSEGNPSMGYCHREPIKGHAIQSAPKLDLSINARTQPEPNYKIVPSFPPTLARLWCVEIKPTQQVIKKISEEMLADARSETDEEKQKEKVEQFFAINKMNS